MTGPKFEIGDYAKYKTTFFEGLGGDVSTVVKIVKISEHDNSPFWSSFIEYNYWYDIRFNERDSKSFVATGRKELTVSETDLEKLSALEQLAVVTGPDWEDEDA